MKQIKKAVELFNREQVELVIHAGDIISPITSQEFKHLECKLIGVFGNNDGEKLYLQETFRDIGEIFEAVHEFELAGLRVALTHIPYFKEAVVKSQEYDLYIYGHTHDLEVRTEGKTTVINPGETATWLRGKSTVCLFDTKSREVEIKDLL